MSKNKNVSIIDIDIITESINEVKANIYHLIKSKGVWIVVTNPNLSVKNDAFESAVILEMEIGIADEVCKDIAKSKAKFSWRTGLPSRMASAIPELLETEDSVWGGSSVLRLEKDKLIVIAVSGLKEYEDEYISHLILDTIKFLIHEKVRKVKKNKGIL